MGMGNLKKIFAYWDLNERSTRSRYIYALQRGAKDATEKSEAPRPIEKKMSFWAQLAMYFGTLIGVLLSFLLRQLDSGQTPHLTSVLTWFNFALSALLPFFIIPHAYRKADVDPDTPSLVKFGLFVQNGTFWPVIIGLVGKTIK
jgi:hypothetical protein